MLTIRKRTTFLMAVKLNSYKGKSDHKEYALTYDSFI